MTSKPGYRSGSGNSAGQVLFGTDMASGLKTARAWTRLRYGTLEPVVSIQKGKAQAANPRGRQYRSWRDRLSTREAKPPNRGTGTERPVVVTIGRNRPGRQKGALFHAW